MDMEQIETQLKKLTPELSMHESQVLWSRVDEQLSPRGVKAPKKKGRRSLFRAATAGFVILGLLGGSVVTAYASEALPGDVLYPTKITLERAQIMFSPEVKKKDLQLAFADRRVKEVSTVLADVEEEPSDNPIPTLMALSEPTPQVVRVASEISSEEHSLAVEANSFLKTVPFPDSVEKETGKTEEQPRMQKSAILPTETSTEERGQMLPTQQVKQIKKWKNLENKKKALSAAIRELERSRKDLERSGATSTSARVDSVIVNLTELNTTGTTADEGFVERMKNHEVDVLQKNTKDDDSSKYEEESDEDRRESSLPPSIKRETSVGAIILGVDSVVLGETQKEMEEVKVRNEERRRKFQQDIRSRQIKIEEQKNGEEKRVPVCFNQSGESHELLVLEKNLSRYTERGFILGACLPPISLDPTPTSDPEDSRVPEEEEKSILEG